MSKISLKKRLDFFIWPLVALVSATALRLHHITAQCFSAKEVEFIREASGELETLLSRPPLYPVLLHYWLELGALQWAPRLLSVLFAVCTVLLIYFLCQRIFNAVTATFAMFFFVFSPFNIYMSQQVSPYTLITCLTVALFLFYLRALDGKSWRPFAVISALGLYTDYLFGLPIVICLCWLLLDKFRNKVNILPMVKGLLAGLLLWVPGITLWTRGPVGKVNIGSETIGIWDSAQSLILSLTAGHAPGLNPWNGEPLAPAFLVVLFPMGLLLLFFLIFHFKEKIGLKIPTWIALCILSLFAITHFMPRQLNYLSAIFAPAMYMAWASGTRKVGRDSPFFSLLALIMVFSISSLSLFNFFTNPRFNHSDWCGLADYIEMNESKHDALVYYADEPAMALLYFYKGTLPQEKLFPDSKQENTPEQIKIKLNGLFEKYRRIWFLNAGEKTYDLTQAANTVVSETCFTDDHPDFDEQYKIPMDLFFTSRKNAFRKLWKTYDTYIDFSKNNFHPSQLDGEIVKIGGDWPWMGQWARMYLRHDEEMNTVQVKVKADLKYHGGLPFNFILLVDGQPVKSFRVMQNGIAEFSALFPSDIRGELIEVGLYTTATFDPKGQIENVGEKPLSFQIGYVGEAYEPQ